MPNFTGQLRPNEIFAALFNMIISLQTFADNIEGADSSLVDRARVDGSMYGDSKLYFATDTLHSKEWLNDQEAQNLLALHRPAAPKCQVIYLNKFRQISLTVDEFLSKRSWGSEAAFSQFQSVMLAWIMDTKKIYDITLYNSYIGTTETAIGNQTISVALPAEPSNATDSELEAHARREAGIIATRIADLLVDLKDVTRDYNDYRHVRAFNPSALQVVWNSEWVNKIRKLDMPTIFHKDGLMDKFDEDVLPARFFGTVNASGGTTTATNLTIRALVEKDYNTVAPGAVGYDASKYVFPGDLLPASTVYLANETYTEDSNVICKIIHNRSVPYMSAMQVATSFFNAKSLTTNHYLTYGHNTLEYLKNYPFITVKKVASV